MCLSMNKWIIRDTKFGTYLINEKTPKLYEVIDARKICKALGESYNDYNFYCFNPDAERQRFVFVTKADIVLEALEEKWGTRAFGYMMEGALFDLSYGRFVSLKSVKATCGEFFYKFMIYDAGTPHIVFDEESGQYVVLSFSQRSSAVSLQETRSITIPTTVTYLKFDANNNVKRNRTVFYEKPTEDDEELFAFIVLDNDLRAVKSQEKATFARCILGKDIKEGEFTYMHSHFFTRQRPFCKTPVAISDMLSYIIGGDTCIVVRSPYGEFGERVLLLVNGEIYYNEKLSFYDLEVVRDITNPNFANHLILKLYYEKSDLENGYFYFDVTDRREYEKISCNYA